MVNNSNSPDKRSLCNLRVLCVSMVRLIIDSSPQRHREHGGCTEVNRRVLYCALIFSIQYQEPYIERFG